MNTRRKVIDLFKQIHKTFIDSSDYWYDKIDYRDLNRKYDLDERESYVISYLLGTFKYTFVAEVAGAIIEVIQTKKFPYKVLLVGILHIAMSVLGATRMITKARDVAQFLNDDDLNKIVFSFSEQYAPATKDQLDYIKNSVYKKPIELPIYGDYDLAEMGGRRFGPPTRNQLDYIKNSMYTHPIELPLYDYYDLAEMGGKRFGPPTKDQLDYIKNSGYKEPLEPMKKPLKQILEDRAYYVNNLTYDTPIGPQMNDVVATSWASSIPGLLIKYGVPGLLAGGAIYGGYKLYDWYKNKEKPEPNIERSMENEMNNIVEAGVSTGPKDYSITDDKPIPIMYNTDPDTREKIKRLVQPQTASDLWFVNK